MNKNETSPPLIKRIMADRWTKRFLILVAGIVTMIFLTVAIINFYGAMKWNAAKRQLQENGFPIQWSELVPPGVPDEENFAMSPLFKDLMNWELKPDGTVDMDAMNVAIEELNKKLPNEVRNLDGYKLNRQESQERFDQRIKKRGEDLFKTIESVDHLLGWVKPTLEEVERALERPHCRFPIRYEDHHMALLPHLSHLRTLVQSFHVRMVSNLDNDRPKEAFQDLRILLRMQKLLENEPILISKLVYAAQLAMTMNAVQEGIHRGAWSESQMKEIIESLREVNMLEQSAQGMKGEQLFFSGISESMIDGTLVGEELGIGVGQGLGAIPSGLIRLNVALNAQLHLERARTEEEIEQRDLSRELVPFEDRLETLPWYGLLVRMLFPALDKAEEKMVQSQALVHSGLTSLEIERYFMKNKKLPDDLADLELGDAIYLKDPFSGDQLKYRKEGDDNYLIYSVNINRTEDGGTEVMDRDRVDRKKGDLLWLRLPLPEEEESEE